MPILQQYPRTRTSLRQCRKCHRSVPSDQIRFRGICAECTRQKSSGVPNLKRLGTSDGLPTFSFEFELVFAHSPHNCTQHGEYCGEPRNLLLHGFERCRDGSVSDEYKSPIYRSMAPFLEVLDVLDGLRDNVTGQCGTHVHVGIGPVAKRRIRLHAAQIFEPLVREMKAHPRRTAQFWGRDFNRYAHSRAWSTRYNWLNVVSSNPTLEYRLTRFRSADQFRGVVEFVRKLTAYLDKQFDHARSPEAYQRIANELVTMYRRASHA